MTSVKLYCSRQSLDDLLNNRADFVAARLEKVNFDDVTLEPVKKEKTDQDHKFAEVSQDN